MDATGWLAIVIALLAGAVMTMAAAASGAVSVTSRRRLTPARSSGEELRRRGEGRYRSVQSLLDPRRSLLASLLIVQVVGAIVAVSLLTAVAQEAVGSALMLIPILIVALAFLLLGQALSAAVATKQSDGWSTRLIRIGRALAWLVWPLTWLVRSMAQTFQRLLPGPAAPLSVGAEDEFRLRALGADEDDQIQAEERLMIDGILHLEDVTARDIMVPRLDIIAVDRAVPARDLVQTFIKAGHSRLPVYQESIDRVLGVIYAKDLLPYVIGTTNRLPLLDLIRPAFVVPESKRLNDLLTELRQAKVHIAIVADEYGGTAGLVTIEDILEEIVGEIQDEYDAEEPLFEQVSDDVLLADGRLLIEDVEDALRLRFEEDDDFGTLSGFVHKHLGRLPMEGDEFIAESVRVDVLSLERHRVRKLRLTRLPPADRDDEPQTREDRTATAPPPQGDTRS